jgi:hypothetical protein
MTQYEKLSVARLFSSMVQGITLQVLQAMSATPAIRADPELAGRIMAWQEQIYQNAGSSYRSFDRGGHA